MGIRDIIYETGLSLLANKARSLLTILGIVIGISSVIAMTSLIGGMQNMMWGQLGLYQARLLQIYSMSTPFEQSDINALQDSFPQVEEVGVVSSINAPVSTTSKSVTVQVSGVTANYQQLFNFDVAQGRDLGEDDQRGASKVLVVGRGVVRDLFGDENAQVVGEKVKVGSNGDSFTIVGVLEGDVTSQQFNVILTPLSTLQARLTGTTGFNNLAALIAEDADVTTTASDVQDFFNDRFNIPEGTQEIIVASMQDMLNQVNIIMTGFSIMLTAIASISLFVGGIGIMNMMLTNVTERTREIGLRKSLGAHTSDITKQFLSESVALCLIGGLLGILFGYGGATLLAIVIRFAMPEMGFAPAVGIDSVLIAVGVCVAIGLVFGIYPARRAAKLDPVESLRYQ